MSRLIDIGPTKALLKKIIPGLSKLPSTVTSLSVLGNTYPIAQLVTTLEGHAAVFQAQDDADAAADLAEEASQKDAAVAVPFTAAVKASLKAALGRQSKALETVGVDPDKVPDPLTPEQEQVKTAKALATRAARHTMGPKQKAAIHGTPATTTTPATTPATPATAPKPSTP